MCVAYAHYYPRRKLAVCRSSPGVETIAAALGLAGTEDPDQVAFANIADAV